ncbi:diguanylate cyclase [bacterium]|nr:diguanylate cyclase [bacterium]
MEKDIKILIVDDDDNMRENLQDILSEEGYKITGAESVETARRQLREEFYNLVLLDIRFPDGSGLELLKVNKSRNADLMIIVCTGFASVESAVDAMNRGAFAYLQKPLNMAEVKITIKKALKMQSVAWENKNLLKKLKELSLKDPLTNLYNYRYLRERLAWEFKRAQRYILPLSVLMVDIDYFKSINDVYGHQYGDVILKELSGYLLSYARANDIVVRYGGEEFLVLLPDTGKSGALQFGKRLLESVQEHVFDLKGKRIKLKISMGIAGFPEDGFDTESGLLDASDQALRNAKETGGNRLSLFQGISQEDMEKIVAKGGKENVVVLKGKLAKMKNRLNGNLLESIYAFARTINAKDSYFEEQTENIVNIVIGIGKEFKLSKPEIENLRHAAILHDLGKIGISDDVLSKKTKLDELEYEEIKKHPRIGAEIIKSIQFLHEVIFTILYHHERYDGLGYSSGLRGEEIPLGARIVAVADVYNALITNRPYRKAFSQEEAKQIIKDGSGTQFDPQVVESFLKVIKKLQKAV